MEEDKIIEEAKKLGIHSETKITHFKIRRRYTELRKDNKYEKTIEILTQEFFLSEGSIKYALARTNK